jgi:hypothetical protein
MKGRNLRSQKNTNHFLQELEAGVGVVGDEVQQFPSSGVYSMATSQIQY